MIIYIKNWSTFLIQKVNQNIKKINITKFNTSFAFLNQK